MEFTDWPQPEKEAVLKYLWEKGYRSERHKIFYVSTPKVACTTLKWWFAALEGKVQALREVTDSAESDPDLIIHGPNFQRLAPDVTGLSPDVLEDVLSSDSYFRFAVVRNPFKRIFSAWQSKLLLQESLQVGPYRESAFLHYPIRDERDVAAAFESFLEHLVCNEAPTFWDVHWTPQVECLRPELINYSAVIKIEEAAELTKALAAWTSNTISNPFAGRRRNESLIPYLPSFITPRSAEIIANLYAKDFEVFGYDKTPPESKETFSAEQLDVAVNAINFVRARHHRLGERNARVATLSRLVEERDSQVAELYQQLTEHKAQVRDLDSSAIEKDAQLNQLSQLVSEREDAIIGLVSTAEERSKQEANLNKCLSDANFRLSQLETLLAGKDAEIEIAQSGISERDAKISYSIKSIETLNKRATAAEGLVARQKAELIQLNDELANIKHVMSGNIVSLQERGEQIESFHRRVRELDEFVLWLQSNVAEREHQILALNELATLTKNQLALNELAAGIRASSALSEVLSSRSWRLTAPIRKISTSVRNHAKSFPFSWGIRVMRLLWSHRRVEHRADVNLLKNSALFNAEYYLQMYSDVQSAGIDPYQHYLEFGAQELRRTSPDFDPVNYLDHNQDVMLANVNPLIHYLRYGQEEGRPAYVPVLSAASDQVDSSIVLDPVIGHYDVEVSAEFSVDEQATAVQQAVMRTPEETRRDTLDKEVADIERSGLFDNAFYLSSYPDLSPADDIIRHYCEFGWQEGRNPSDDFNTNFYLKTYDDIRNASLNPFWHFVIAGANESRQPVAPVSTPHRDDIWFGKIKTDIKVLAFYKSPDWMSLRGGQPEFKGHVQPVMPEKSLGFYDVMDPATLGQQARIACAHGIRGFVFDLNADYPLSSQPVGVVADHSEIRIDFCARICLVEGVDAAALVQQLVSIFDDERYISVDDRPVVLFDINDADAQSPNFARDFLSLLSNQAGNPVYAVGMTKDISDPSLGLVFDAVMLSTEGVSDIEMGYFSPLQKNGISVVPYHVVASQGAQRVREENVNLCPVYHTVTLGRDNTTDKSSQSLVYTRFQVSEYRIWLDSAIDAARDQHEENRRFLFVNAWNDWNSGLYLEPDKVGGFSRLNETSRALLNQSSEGSTPKVSVIVPNYNHEPYLRKRLDSIYGQTYKNIEVILMDDCSRDGSRSVLQEYASAYPDTTRLLFNAQNSGGVFCQWAKGIKAAKGELVWIAESDDYCDLDFVETLVRCFEDEAVLLAYANSVFVDKYEVPMRHGFANYVKDLPCASKWLESYVETAHNEVCQSLGVKNTIPNASGVIFKRPVEMSLLDDVSWLSMRVAGDWVFYLHALRGGKVAFRADVNNYFRRYQGSTAETTYKKDTFYKEVGLASRTVAALYNVPLSVLERCEQGYRSVYNEMLGRSEAEFEQWYDYSAILSARKSRQPAIMVSTMGFYPGGAEILPIRLCNEFKRQGHSVLLLSANLNPREEGVRRMLRNDVPLIETSSVEAVREIIKEFGIEALNSHQWHIQKYPLQVPDVFDQLGAHVASLHGMIEHGDAFKTTEEQLRTADGGVSTWVYTAEKNLVPFSELGLYDASDKFIKVPNGLEPPVIKEQSRSLMGIPDDAFVLCCVSRAIPDKGWAESIAAVTLARKSTGVDIRLILVGNGPVYDEYCRVGVPDFVYLAGFSENSVGYYAAADMGIMLTKFKSESFPLTIVDCLFAGKPYIACAVGDIENMLTSEEGVAGEVVRLDDWQVPIQEAAASIASYASNEDKYLSALEMVEKVSSRYRIDVVAAQYLALFNRDMSRSVERTHSAF